MTEMEGSSELYQVVCQQTQTPIIITQYDGQFISANPSAIELFHLPKNNLTSYTLEQLIPQLANPDALQISIPQQNQDDIIFQVSTTQSFFKNTPIISFVLTNISLRYQTEKKSLGWDGT
jgi:PAS domain-containing protein